MTAINEKMKLCPCCGSIKSDHAAIKLYSDLMLERAARAICDDQNRVLPGNTIWGMLTDAQRRPFISRAKAALEAALRWQEE